MPTSSTESVHRGIARRPPALLIRVEFEAAPRLTINCDHESDQARLCDWIFSNPNPKLGELVGLAIELHEQEEAV